MTHDINTLKHYLLIVVVVSAVGATSVPIIYSFSKWWINMLGRLFMLQSVAFAMAIDLTVLFQFWIPGILTIFWIETATFTAIAISTMGLTWWIFRLNIRARRGSSREYQTVK